MLYLYYGPDEFSRTEAVHALRASLPPDVAHFNSATLDGRSLTIEALATTCEAVPFLADRRVVIAHDVLKHFKTAKLRQQLLTWLPRLPDSCDLAFVEQESVDRRTSLYSYFKKHATIQEFLPRQGKDLLAWLNERARGLGVKLDRTAASHLADYVGDDSRALVNELEKLSCYVGRGGKITADDVILLVQDNQEYNLFAFMDNLSQRQRGAALQGLHALLEEGQAPAYILFMVIRQVRILLNVEPFAGQRPRSNNVNDIAAQVNQKPFVVKKALEQVKRFRAGELAALHDRLLELDHATKRGQIQADIALDMVVLEVCGSSLVGTLG